MRNPIDQLFQESLQRLYEIYENGLNSLHSELSNLAETVAANDGSMQRALMSLERRMTMLETQVRKMKEMP